MTVYGSPEIRRSRSATARAGRVDDQRRNTRTFIIIHTIKYFLRAYAHARVRMSCTYLLKNRNGSVALRRTRGIDARWNAAHRRPRDLLGEHSYGCVVTLPRVSDSGSGSKRGSRCRAEMTFKLSSRQDNRLEMCPDKTVDNESNLLSRLKIKKIALI